MQKEHIPHKINIAYVYFSEDFKVVCANVVHNDFLVVTRKINVYDFCFLYFLSILQNF